MSDRALLTDDQIASIYSGYNAGLTHRQIARSVGCSRSTVTRHVAQGRRTGALSVRQEPRRYPLREDAFRVLTPESAYWLGFLLADGCLTDDNSLRVGVHERDRDHVTRLLRFLGSPKNPSRGPNNQARFGVGSKILAADLRHWGIHPRKTGVEEAHPDLARWPSFWLGILDGDGTVYVPAGREPSLIFHGSQRLLEQFRDFVRPHLDGWAPRAAPIRRSPLLWRTTVSGGRAKRLVSVLYDGSPVALPRKAAKAQVVAAYESVWTRAAAGTVIRECAYCGASVRRLPGRPPATYVFCQRAHFDAWRREGGELLRRAATAGRN